MTTVQAPHARPGLGRVLVLPGVYAPQADSRLLAEAIRQEDVSGLDVLDLCSHLLASWRDGRTALREPIRDPVP